MWEGSFEVNLEELVTFYQTKPINEGFLKKGISKTITAVRKHRYAYETIVIQFGCSGLIRVDK